MKSELGLSKSSAYRYEALWREAQAALGPEPSEDEIATWLENRRSQPKSAANALPLLSEDTSVSNPSAEHPSPDRPSISAPAERKRRLSRRRQNTLSDSPDDSKGRAARNDALQLVGLVDHFVRSKVASHLDPSSRELLVRCLMDAAADLSPSRR